MRKTFKLLTAFILLLPYTAIAEVDWLTFTLDNDIFVGNDSGYSNGMVISWADVGRDEEKIEPRAVVLPLLWGMDANKDSITVNIDSIGQAIITPEDITVEVPDENQMPYSGLLFYTNIYLSVKQDFADQVSTTLGLVGPSSGGEQIQKMVHSMTGSDEPKGWDTQLKDEPVFQLSRGRIWRTWESSEKHFDILLNSKAGIGNLHSLLGAGITLRYGKKLEDSFSTHLLSTMRSSNPIALNRGWYVYADISAVYTFNQIFTDGNSFRDSRSIDYRHDAIEAGIGFAYSWDDITATLAINDMNILEDNSEEQLEDLTRYGTLTIAWRI